MSAPDVLDVANFQLKAFEVAAEKKAELMEAEAKYQLAMIDVLEKRVKIETDLFRLRMMQDAYQDYCNARRQSLQKLRVWQAKTERFETAVRRVGYLLLGEASSGYQCRLGWRGFWYLASQAPVNSVVEMANVSCSEEDRQRQGFFDPETERSTRMSVPENLASGLSLMDWARSNDLIPRLGSSAMARLQELIVIMSEGAQQLVAETELRRREAELALLDVRRANWQTLEIEFPKAR